MVPPMMAWKYATADWYAGNTVENAPMCHPRGKLGKSLA